LCGKFFLFDKKSIESLLSSKWYFFSIVGIPTNSFLLVDRNISLRSLFGDEESIEEDALDELDKYCQYRYALLLGELLKLLAFDDSSLEGVLVSLASPIGSDSACGIDGTLPEDVRFSAIACGRVPDSPDGPDIREPPVESVATLCGVIKS